MMVSDFTFMYVSVRSAFLVISNPMDFATMLKKVKSKQYKSKREFKDDLELIWANCYTYNAAEVCTLYPCHSGRVT